MITKPKMKNYKKYCKHIVEIFEKKKKLKRELMITVEIKVYQIWMGKEEKDIQKIITMKRKTF